MLSVRERQVLSCIARGLSNDETAAELGLAPVTIKTHLARIFRREGVATRADLVVWGYRMGLLQRMPVQGHKPPVALTDREREMIMWIIKGKTNREIGRAIFLSEQTIKTHVRRMLKKTGARSRAHAVTLAWQHDLVPHEAFEVERAIRPERGSVPFMARKMRGEGGVVR